MTTIITIKSQLTDEFDVTDTQVDTLCDCIKPVITDMFKEKTWN